MQQVTSQCITQKMKSTCATLAFQSWYTNASSAKHALCFDTQKSDVDLMDKRFCISYFRVFHYEQRDLNSNTLSNFNRDQFIRRVLTELLLGTVKMFRLLFLFALAVFLASSFGTSQKKSANKVNIQLNYRLRNRMRHWYAPKRRYV